jgi:hypothetical protein
MPLREPARHERPLIDEAALVAARDADRILFAARERGLSLWAEFFDSLPDHLRDGELKELRAVAMRARSAFGAKDSVRDALPADLTEPFLADIDRLLKVLAREALERRLEA